MGTLYFRPQLGLDSPSCLSLWKREWIFGFVRPQAHFHWLQVRISSVSATWSTNLVSVSQAPRLRKCQPSCSQLLSSACILIRDTCRVPVPLALIIQPISPGPACPGLFWFWTSSASSLSPPTRFTLARDTLWSPRVINCVIRLCCRAWDLRTHPLCEENFLITFLAPFSPLSLS